MTNKNSLCPYCQSKIGGAQKEIAGKREQHSHRRNKVITFNCCNADCEYRQTKVIEFIDRSYSGQHTGNRKIIERVPDNSVMIVDADSRDIINTNDATVAEELRTAEEHREEDESWIIIEGIKHIRLTTDSDEDKVHDTVDLESEGTVLLSDSEHKILD